MNCAFDVDDVHIPENNIWPNLPFYAEGKTLIIFSMLFCSFVFCCSL